jgi:HprK-related kinase A
MNLGDLPVAELERLLRRDGLGLQFGPVRVRLRTDIAALAPVLRSVYAAYPVEDPGGFFDIAGRLAPVRGARRLLRPQVSLTLDGNSPFEAFPADTHFPLLEWGVNWAIATRCNQHLLLHSGVVERGGRAVVLPALPASGKSTLTAALANRGYRLLSDEFGVVRLADAMLLPMPRAVALKNESIGIIRAFAPEAVLGPEFPKTRKGTVAHLAPNAASVAARQVPAAPGLVVFPAYTPGIGAEVERFPKARAFAKLSVNSFNYELLGPTGFDAVGALISRSACYQLRFGNLDAAIAEVGRLLDARIANVESALEA